MASLLPPLFKLRLKLWFKSICGVKILSNSYRIIDKYNTKIQLEKKTIPLHIWMCKCVYVYVFLCVGGVIVCVSVCECVRARVCVYVCVESICVYVYVMLVCEIERVCVSAHVCGSCLCLYVYVHDGMCLCVLLVCLSGAHARTCA